MDVDQVTYNGDVGISEVSDGDDDDIVDDIVVDNDEDDGRPERQQNSRYALLNFRYVNA